MRVILGPKDTALIEELSIGDVFSHREEPFIKGSYPIRGSERATRLSDGEMVMFCGDERVTPHPEAVVFLKGIPKRKDLA